jgi:hypothetical protein
MTCVRALLMIRPAAFGFNPQTAASNAFQNELTGDTAQQARDEFDGFVAEIKKHGIPVLVIDDQAVPAKPDAVFPNNWFSTHDNRTIVLYPMLAPNRRPERRNDVVEMLKSEFGYRTVQDLTRFELEGKFLEGTGSLVFDHAQKIVYAAISERTDRDVLLELCELLGYLPLVFSTAGKNGKPVYHTNVVMALNDTIAVVCLDCIVPAKDRRAVERMLAISGKKILPISLSQLEAFAGNMLFVTNENGERYVLLSQTAWNSLDPSQKILLEASARPIVANIPLIESAGGGSARCMITELF